MSNYISLKGPVSPSMTPFTVSSRVFIHQPRTPKLLAACSVFCYLWIDVKSLDFHWKKLKSSSLNFYLSEENTWKNKQNLLSAGVSICYIWLNSPWTIPKTSNSADKILWVDISDFSILLKFKPCFLPK